MKFTIFTAVALFGAASAVPFAHKEASIVQRDVNVLGLRFLPRDHPLPAYEPIQYASHAKKDELHLRDHEDDHLITPKIIHRAPQDIPAEVAVKSENGQIVPYAKRQDIPAEVAVKSENGNIVPYAKRQDIPAEVAVKSENGNIVPYKRQENVIPAEVAVKSENGQIVPY